MSNISSIRDAIKAVMDTVTDVGQVQSFERFAKRTSAFKDFYLYQGQIRGWHIRRMRTPASSGGIGLYDEIYNWQLRGFMSLSDENKSERDFDELIERVVLVFRDNDTLNGTVTTCIVAETAGVQVERTGHVMLAGVLCHEVVLTLNCLVMDRG